MATVATPTVENPTNISDLNSEAPNGEDASIETQPPPSSTGSDDSKTAPSKTSEVEGGDAVTDIQKKMKRAERFGVSVKLSEEEKRNSRAERFGTVSTVNGSDSSKQSEDLKRKARAERFGVVKSSVSADEEAKKKARADRFGSISKTDSVEEDKKKARAIRFSEHTGAALKENGAGKIEKAAIAGKAGAGT